MEFLRSLFVDYLGPTILYGTGVWALMALLFKGLESWKGDMPNWLKVIISVTVPYLLVAAVYWGGVYVEAWQYDKKAWLDILGSVTQGIIGSKGVFSLTEFFRSWKAGNAMAPSSDTAIANKPPGGGA